MPETTGTLDSAPSKGETVATGGKAPAAKDAGSSKQEAKQVNDHAAEDQLKESDLMRESLQAGAGKKRESTGLMALHHIVHDHVHYHPGDALTLGGEDAAQLIAAKSAVESGHPDAKRLLKQANAARARALSESGAMPAAAASMNRRVDDPIGETFESTPYPDDEASESETHASGASASAAPVSGFGDFQSGEQAKV